MSIAGGRDRGRGGGGLRRRLSETSIGEPVLILEAAEKYSSPPLLVLVLALKLGRVNAGAGTGVVGAVFIVTGPACDPVGSAPEVDIDLLSPPALKPKPMLAAVGVTGVNGTPLKPRYQDDGLLTCPCE